VISVLFGFSSEHIVQRLQIYLISFTNLESTILPIYLGDSLLASTEYTAGFYTFQREVKEIEGMNRNNKGWEPE